jgi:lipid-A-disaccharide synthase
MSRRVFITVAEVSGDQHAANLARSLRELDPTLLIEGHGGQAMLAAGVTIHNETVRDAAMSIHGATRALEMWRVFQWTKKYFDGNRPDLLICIDSPDMNLHFAKIAHKRGIPVLYYVAPQLWAWRKYRMKQLRKRVDELACILPFEEEYFRRHGVKATFVGHPLFDQLPSAREPAKAPYAGDRPPVVALVGGSRKSEAVANFSALLEVARRICAEFPGATFLAPTTAGTTPIVRPLVEEFNRTMGAEVVQFAEGEFDRMLPRCDLSLTVSGTATLHVAGHGVPMIVVYRGSPWLWHLLGRWVVKTRTYALVNLLNDSAEHIVPEFIPWLGSVEPMALCAIDFLRNPKKLAEQREKLHQLVRKLDKPGASMNVAKMAMGMMGAAFSSSSGNQ